MIRRVIINALLFLVCTTCGSFGDPVEDAEKWCDCYSKAVASGKYNMTSAMYLCQDLLLELSMKYKNDPVKIAKFSQGVLECTFGGLLELIE